jgi:predicted small lipoprotein YifL
MLRASAAAVRFALAAFALAAFVAGCGIKGPLRLPAGATPAGGATTPETAPPKPTASDTRVEPDEGETKP